MRYRSEIDGMRAVAVLSVVVFHLSNRALPGGFAGVDVFFVISGYLISKGLIENIDGPGLSFIDFYHRRIRRILPAALVVISVSVIAGYFFLLPGDYALVGKSAIFSSFGFANFFFYSNTGYFDPQAKMQPLLHMWSLGVEEQFYMVWPLALAGFAWMAKGRHSAMVALIGAVIAGSFALWFYELQVRPGYAFYQPQARAWELAVGALLVFLPRTAAGWWAEGAALAGFGFVVTSFAIDDWSVDGTGVILAVVGTTLLIWPKNSTLVARCLSVAPMVWIGQISYSLYLWHWPVLVYFRQYANGMNPTPVEAIFYTFTVFGIAYLSWRYVEKPMRRPWRPLLAIGTGIGAATAVAATAVVVVKADGFSGRLQGDATNMASRAQMGEWNCPQFVTLSELGGSFCTFGASWQTADTRGILWGDSHAEHMAPILQAASSSGSASFLVFGPCPAIVDGTIKRLVREDTRYNENCARDRETVLRWLSDNHDVRIVVLSSAWGMLANPRFYEGVTNADFDGIRFVSSRIEEIIKNSVLPGRRYILVGQVPSMGIDPAPCIVADAMSLTRRPCFDIQKELSEYTEKHIAPVNRAIKEIAGKYPAQAEALIPSDTLCYKGKCMVSMNCEFLYRDSNHLRRNLSPETRKEFAERIGLSDVVRNLVGGDLNRAD